VYKPFCDNVYLSLCHDYFGTWQFSVTIHWKRGVKKAGAVEVAGTISAGVRQIQEQDMSCDYSHSPGHPKSWSIMASKMTGILWCSSTLIQFP
jgi:hypothetical protein